MFEYLKTMFIAKGAGRMKEVGLIGLVLLIVVALIAPERVGTVISKISLLGLASTAGYWIDRTAFKPERRPHMLVGFERTHAEYRRAAIIGCAMLAVALAL